MAAGRTHGDLHGLNHAAGQVEHRKRRGGIRGQLERYVKLAPGRVWPGWLEGETRASRRGDPNFSEELIAGITSNCKLTR